MSFSLSNPWGFARTVVVICFVLSLLAGATKLLTGAVRRIVSVGMLVLVIIGAYIFLNKISTPAELTTQSGIASSLQTIASDLWTWFTGWFKPETFVPGATDWGMVFSSWFSAIRHSTAIPTPIPYP